MTTPNLECVGGVATYRQAGRTILGRICPVCKGYGCTTGGMMTTPTDSLRQPSPLLNLPTVASNATEAEGTAREPMSLQTAELVLHLAREGLGQGRPLREYYHNLAMFDAALAVKLAAEYARGHADGMELAAKAAMLKVSLMGGGV